MKIKNPETGEVIVIPQGMEDAVRNAIESGNDPMEVMQMKYGGIYINPANKGKFNATKKATGKTTEELTHSNNPLTRKRAIFAQNAAKWKHEYGGQLPKAQVGDIIPADNAEFKKPYRTTDPEGRPYYDPGDYGVDYGNLTKQFNNSMGDYTNERLSGVDPQLRGGYRNFLENQYWEGGFNGVGNDGINVQDNNTQPPVLATSSYRAQQKNPYSTTENPISLNPGTNNLNWGQSTSLGNPNYSDPSSNSAAPYNSSPANNSSIGFGNFQSPLNQYGFDNSFNSNAPSYPQPYSGQSNNQQQNNNQQNNGFRMALPSQEPVESLPLRGLDASGKIQGVQNTSGLYGYDPDTGGNVDNNSMNKIGDIPSVNYNGKEQDMSSNNKFNINHLFGPSSNKYFNRAAIFGNAALAGVNATKGILDNLGNSARNARTARQESQLEAKGLRYNNINGMPQNQRYDQNNPLLMEFGGNISVNNFKAQNGANVEAEGGEHILTPSGLSGQLSGNSHSMGGENMQLPENSMIFSKKLKDPLTKKSYAQMAKPFSTEKDMNNLQKLSTNKVSKETAQLNIQLKNKKLKELFEQQEYNKATGKHGMEVMYQTLDEREQQHNPQEQMQPQGQMGYGGMSMYSDGGMPMYDNGGLNNLGFKALPNYVQQNIINNMSHGGFFRPQNGDIYTTQMAYGGIPMAKDGLLSQAGYDVIDQFENSKGSPQGTSMEKGAGYSKTKEEEIKSFIESTIGMEAWNKLPDNLKTQTYSFMFNHAADPSVWKGLAQAIDFDKYAKGDVDMDKARQSISADDAINTIKNAKIDNKTYNNYVNQVLPAQYQTFADNYDPTHSIKSADQYKKTGQYTTPEFFKQGQEIYNNTWKNRASDINQMINNNSSANVNAVAAVPGIAPNNNPASGIAPSNNVTATNANTSTTTTTATPTGTKTTTAINNDKLGIYDKKAVNKYNIDYNEMNKAGNDLWTDANYKTQWIPKVDNAFAIPENQKILIDRLENYGGQDANDVKLALSKAKTFEEKVAIAKKLATDYKPGPYHSIVNELIDEIPEIPVKKPPKDLDIEEKETSLEELPKFNYQGQPQPNNYNISLGNFNIPSNLAKDPVALGLTDPSYIDPRYLDIQPQLNDIQRGKSMFQRNLGSRTSTDIGNLLQSQALGYDQAQQAYGQKYNYDQQQDNNAQQFNAEARMNTAERNMNRVDAFNDLRYRRDAAATLQQQNKEQQEIQNSMLQNNYDTRNNFIGEHFSYPGANTPYSLGQGYASGVQGNEGDYTSMKKNKDGTRTYTYEKTVSANGGLVIKPKKKMKKLK